MARPKMIVSKTELAKILGLSKGRISQLYQREDFPKRPDGRVDRAKAVAWYENVGLAQQIMKRGPKPKRVKSASGPKESLFSQQAKVSGDTGEDIERRVRLAALQAICSPAEAIQFARVMVGLGLTKAQVFAAATWHVIAPALIDLVPDEDLNELDTPTDAEWHRLLGNFDIAAAETSLDRASTPIILPENDGDSSEAATDREDQ